MANAGPPFERPLSPHLQVWKMDLVMMNSGLHRITGMLLYVGTVLLVAYLFAVLLGPDAYAWAAWFFNSWLGRLVLFGYTWTLFHHMLGGIRHFIWDTGAGLEPGEREKWSTATLIGSVALTALTWFVVMLR